MSTSRSVPRELKLSQKITNLPRDIVPARNLVLDALAASELQQILSASKLIHLNQGDTIYDAGDEIDYLYFPTNSVASALALLMDGSSVEIFMTGCEGIVGVSAFVGSADAVHWTRVAVGGAALRISATIARELFKSSETLHSVGMQAYRNVVTQISQRSVCNIRHSLIQRLCVWLLMMHDRAQTDALPFTQEEIAKYISVRRAGVSVAASRLQAMHAISYHRGSLVITDRDVLEYNACECYRAMAHDFHENSED